MMAGIAACSIDLDKSRRFYNIIIEAFFVSKGKKIVVALNISICYNCIRTTITVLLG